MLNQDTMRTEGLARALVDVWPLRPLLQHAFKMTHLQTVSLLKVELFLAQISGGSQSKEVTSKTTLHFLDKEQAYLPGDSRSH